MVVLNIKPQLYSMPVDSEVGFKILSQKGLYLELSSMNDITRTTTIKKMNESAGYELVNFKLLSQLYKDSQDSEKPTVTSITERDYMKAYMRLLSS